MTTALAPNFEIVENADGTALVRDVPIFAVCEKSGVALDEAWLDAAVAYHGAAERNGRHVPPMSIGHYGEPEPAKAAGAFSGIRKGMVRSKGGQTVPGAIADLHLTSADAVARAKRGELLWRSPEIPVENGKPAHRFRSLALLDKPPHNELPVLTLRAAKADAKAPAWAALADGAAVLAFASTDETIVALMAPDAVAVLPPKPGVLKRVLDAVVRFASGDPKAVEGDSLRLESESSDGPAALVEKVKGLTAEDLAKFHVAYAAFRAAVGAGGGAIESTLGNPGGGVTMADDSKVVALSAEVEALKVANKARDAKDALAVAVDAAHAKCKDRGVSRDDVLKFAESFPGDPVKAAGAYADAILAKVPKRDGSFEDVIRGAASDQIVPDAVLKFQNDGEKFEAAKKHHKSWQAATAAHTTALPLDRWLEARMNLNGFVRAPVNTEV